MYNKYSTDFILRNKLNHPMKMSKLVKISLITTDNLLVENQKSIYYLILNYIIRFNQFPLINRAKKNLSAFNIRKNNLIGIIMNLTKFNIYNFIPFFICAILPNLRRDNIIKFQKKSNKRFVVNFGVSNLNLWWQRKDLKTSGINIQLHIHSINQIEFLYFVSKFMIKLT